ncbi:MAG: hypothetical protein LBE13_17020 [Bacteroidales bacterium]|jgi:hypothetical protein|nr:hypothetical protein [Bacteroidales bacterium]
MFINFSFFNIRDVLCVLFLILLSSISYANDSCDNSTTINSILEEIREFRKVHGFPPTMADYFIYLKRLPENTIDENTSKKILPEIFRQQQPRISVTELLKVFRTKREAIDNYSLKYNVLIKHFDSQNNFSRKEESVCEYSACKNKLLLDKTEYSTTEGIVRYRKAYDGEFIYTLRTSNSTPPQAGVSLPHSLGTFFHPWMPLTLAGIFDTKKCNFADVDYDMVMFLEGDFFNGRMVDGVKLLVPPYVFEKSEKIEGRECLVVSTLMENQYFDSDRDFSLIRTDRFRPIASNSSNGPILTGRVLSSKTILHDLHDYGNGIWLPDRIVKDYYDNKGMLSRQDTVTVSSIEINKGIDDTYFTDFIPDDVIVSDTANKAVYRWGERDSINSLIKDTVKSKRIFIYRYISIISGLALIFIALAMKYRQYLKNKHERENRTEEIK